MPKLKTNRGAAKRFRKTKNGKIMRGKAGTRHLKTAKSPKTPPQPPAWRGGRDGSSALEENASVLISSPGLSASQRSARNYEGNLYAKSYQQSGVPQPPQEF